ncbi:hypothetical protein D0812_21960 [Vibrio owensii]|uniref:Uncharacterized protein n=1 Tax=Vibrio owensii TaxID=696485 RepID=A0AAP9GFY6_9VIBR|nr:hypothetical protein [Vibrio owensii]AYO17056.1 hypothetical protein D0812_21960 [Vibrio owensii]QGH49205.1 hypothetical protein APZ19_18985 [Vibrio owensii]
MIGKRSPHAFDVDLADKYGIDAALVIGRIAHFVEYHRNNKTQFHDGHYWTYDTAAALAAHFTYWSPNKIQKLMKRLEEKGLIVSGDFSENRAVRPKYYRLGDVFHPQPDAEEPISRLADSTISQTADSTESQMADSSLPIQSTEQSSDLKKVNKKSPIPKKYANLDFSSLGFNESEVLEFIQLRENKRAGITDRVIKNISRELEIARSAGFTNDQILNVWSDRGWTAFKAEWLRNAVQSFGRDNQNHRNNFESKHDPLGGFNRVN